MKKCLGLILAAAAAAAFLAGCASNSSSAPSPEASPSGAEAAPGPVKTGLAFVTALDNSKDAGEENGCGQADSVLAAVTVDEAGKVVRCVIDMAVTKAEFDASGQLVTPLDATFQTKNEQADTYGMAASSSIGKEWCEQAAALADYVTGKTAGEIRGIAVDASGCPTGGDLKASVTVSISGLVGAVLKAMENARELGASASDKLGVGAETNILYSAGAAGGKNGSVLIYATYAAVTTDAAGRITSCAADGFQTGIEFNASGKLVSDLASVPPTKNETGDAYGLKAFSSINKEWFEQTAAFAQYVAGKTAEEVGGIAVKADTSPSSEDLRATVTLKIGAFKKVIVKAAEYAA